MMLKNSEKAGYRSVPRRSGVPGLTEIAKYLVVAVIIAYIVLLMVYTSGSTKSFDTIKQAVEASLDTTGMKKTDGQGFKRYYGLTAADYDGVMFYTSESSMSAEEILLIKVKDEGQMKRVRETVEKRVANRKNEFEGYAPKQVQLLENAQLTVRGEFLFLAVTLNAETYKETFAKSL